MNLHQLQRQSNFAIAISSKKSMPITLKILFLFFYLVLFATIVFAEEDMGKIRHKLLKAISNCSVTKLESLLKNNTIHQLKKSGKSVRRIPERLYFKCNSNDFCNVLPLLISKGSDIHKKTGSGEGLLHIAVRQSDITAIKCLVANGADPKKKIGRKSPIQLAKRLKKRKIFEILTQRKHDQATLDKIFKKRDLSKTSYANKNFSLYSSLKIRKNIPARVKTITKKTTTWNAREVGKHNKKVLCLDEVADHLESGSDVTILSFVLADIMEKKDSSLPEPCGQKYIPSNKRPSRKEMFWAKVRYKNLNQQEKTGYTSITNFSVKSIPNKQLNKIVPFVTKLNKYGLLFGKEMWKLPTINGVSYFDLLGWNHYLAKQIYKDSKIVVSRDELEFFAEGDEKNNLSYIGIPNRIPEHYGGVPPLIQPITIKPGLKVAVIYENGIEFLTITHMKSESYFSFDIDSAQFCRREINCTYELPIPLIFNIPNKLKQKPLIFMLLSEKASLELQKKADTIEVKTIRSKSKDGFCLIGDVYESFVDFNKDGTPEIKFDKIEYRLKEGCEAEESPYTLIHIAMLHNGKWYRTAYSAPGQDGTEGF